MSDTPMTDARRGRIDDDGWIYDEAGYYVAAFFAERLERQLNAAHADITRQVATMAEQATEIEALRTQLAAVTAEKAEREREFLEVWNESRDRIEQLRAELAAAREVIADDAYAMTFQTMAQYRTALLKRLGGL